jgi:hypothetical protein
VPPIPQRISTNRGRTLPSTIYMHPNGTFLPSTQGGRTLPFIAHQAKLVSDQWGLLQLQHRRYTGKAQLSHKQPQCSFCGMHAGMPGRRQLEEQNHHGQHHLVAEKQHRACIGGILFPMPQLVVSHHPMAELKLQRGGH